MGIYLVGPQVSREDKMAFLDFLTRIEFKGKSQDFIIKTVIVQLQFIAELKHVAYWEQIQEACLDLAKQCPQNKALSGALADAMIACAVVYIEDASDVASLKEKGAALLTKGLGENIFSFRQTLELFTLITSRFQRLESGDFNAFYDEIGSLVMQAFKSADNHLIVFGITAFQLLGGYSFALDDVYSSLQEKVEPCGFDCMTIMEEKAFLSLQQLMLTFFELAKTNTELQKNYLEKVAHLFQKIYIDRLLLVSKNVPLKKIEDPEKLAEIVCFEETGIELVPLEADRKNIENFLHELTQRAYETGDFNLYANSHRLRLKFFESERYYGKEALKADLSQPKLMNEELMPKPFEQVLCSFPHIPLQEIQALVPVLQALEREEAKKTMQDLCCCILENSDYVALESCFTLYRELRDVGVWQESDFRASIDELRVKYADNICLLSALDYQMGVLEEL